MDLPEPGQDLARVHAALEELQRHLAPHGVRLLRSPDEAETAFAEFFHQAKGSQDIASFLIAVFQGRDAIFRQGTCGGFRESSGIRKHGHALSIRIMHHDPPNHAASTLPR